MKDLSDYYYCYRAGLFANCLNSNDKLPIVYGNLLDGANGNWELPCIDAVNHVYCYNVYPSLATSAGNTVVIYADGVLKDPSTYVFSTGNSTYGGVATIKFVDDLGNAKVTARGKGTDSAGVLIENIIYIGWDFLTYEAGAQTSDFDLNSGMIAYARFENSSYKAAGVICEDEPYWTIIQRMIGSFNGQAYYNANKKLVIDYDPGGELIGQNPEIIRKSEVANITARHTRENLVNRCPVSFAYNYSEKKFLSYTDKSSQADAASISVYSTQGPASPFELHWVRSSAVAESIQDVIVSKWKKPVWEINFQQNSLKSAHLETGDIISLGVDFLYGADGNSLKNEFWKIIGVSHDLQRGIINFRAMDLSTHFPGSTLSTSYYFDGTWTFNGTKYAMEESTYQEPPDY